MATTKELSRTQLIGMIATLRGELYALVDGYRCAKDGEDDLAINDEDVESATKLLEQTAFDLDPKDEVKGGYDGSWRLP